MENQAKRKIVIGADSAGYSMKEEFKKHLAELGYDVTDMGPDSDASCHYPIYAAKVAEAVADDPDGTFGILICGTGIGMSMCANKFNGVRAAVCTDTYMAELTRRHNDANVICLGARVITTIIATRILDAFLDAPFEGGRHAIRVGLIGDIEKKNAERCK